MKLQFKIQPYQTDAVDAVVDVFAGQPRRTGISYRIDPGKVKPSAAPALFETSTTPDSGLRNAEIELLRDAAAREPPPGAEVAEPAAGIEGRRQQGRARRSEPRHRDGDRHRQDLRLHQDDHGAEQALRLVEVHHRRAVRGDPRGREEVVRRHGRALPAGLRHEAALVHLQLLAAARARAVQLRRRRPGHDHQHPGLQRDGQGQPAHLRRAGRLPVPQADRRDQREPADRHHRRAAEDRRLRSRWRRCRGSTP